MTRYMNIKMHSAHIIRAFVLLKLLFAILHRVSTLKYLSTNNEERVTCTASKQQLGYDPLSQLYGPQLTGVHSAKSFRFNR